MKSLPYILLVLSFGLFAQVRTGGGHHEPELHGVDSEGEVGSHPSQMSKLMRAYTAHLKQREVECRSTGEKYLAIDPDIMQVYLKLSVLKNTFVADNKCSDLNTYLKCLQDDEAKNKLKAILTNKNTIPYLMKEYKLSKKEVKSILDFFKGLDAPCSSGTQSCEM
jgi:hypothetical protein